MAQSNNEANRAGILNRLAGWQDRVNLVPGMNNQGRFSWGELGRDAFRTAGNALFPGLGSLLGRGLNNSGGSMRFNFDQRIASPVRGVGTSIGRMFDNDPSTGFFNNPTAPWNNTPANVPEGSWDFMGPPAPGGTQSPTQPPAPQQPSPSTPDRMFSNGFGGSANRSQVNAAGQAFNSRTPSHWRRTGTSGSWGTGGGLSNPWTMGDFFGSSGTVQSMHGIIK